MRFVANYIIMMYRYLVVFIVRAWSSSREEVVGVPDKQRVMSPRFLCSCPSGGVPFVRRLLLLVYIKKIIIIIIIIIIYYFFF